MNWMCERMAAGNADNADVIDEDETIEGGF